MLRSIINDIIMKMPSPIKAQALAELDKIPMQYISNSEYFLTAVLAQEEVEQLIINLINAYSEYKNSCDTYSNGYLSFGSLMHDLINISGFDIRIKSIWENYFHNEKRSRWFYSNDRFYNDFATFLNRKDQNKRYFTNNPQFTDAINEYVQSERDLLIDWETLVSWHNKIINIYKDDKSFTFSKNVYLFILYLHNLCVSQFDTLSKIFRNEFIYNLPYVQSILLRHCIKFKNIQDIYSYLLKLQENKILNETTTSIEISNKESMHDLISVLLLIKKCNLMSLDHIKLDKMIQPKYMNKNPISVGLIIHRYFDFSDAARLSRTSQFLHQTFQPSLKPRNQLHIIKILASNKYLINSLKEILTYWERKDLCNSNNFISLLNYFSMFVNLKNQYCGKYDSVIPHDFLKKCTGIINQNDLDMLFIQYQNENDSYRIIETIRCLIFNRKNYKPERVAYENVDLISLMYDIFMANVDQSLKSELNQQSDLKPSENQLSRKCYQYLQMQIKQLVNFYKENPVQYQNLLNNLLHELIQFDDIKLLDIVLSSGADIDSLYIKILSGIP